MKKTQSFLSILPLLLLPLLTSCLSGGHRIKNNDTETSPIKQDEENSASHPAEINEKIGGIKNAVVIYTSDRLVPIVADADRQEMEETAPVFIPVESEQDLREELAALERVGDWSIDDRMRQDTSPVQYMTPCDITSSKDVTSTDTIKIDFTQISSLPAVPADSDPAPDSGKNMRSDKAKKIVCDFPIIVNKQVEFYLDQFQNKQRGTFTRWLERSARYLPVISKELKKADLPQSLAYLAMIESGFNPSAYSHAHAAGLWQFIRSTGANYGLRINSWVDERRNPEKATKAAVAYLGALHKRFGDWQLAVAAYNAGEGKIARGLKKYNAENFWELADHDYLSLETKRYVPKLIAAIIVANNLEKYGFKNLTYKKPVLYDLLKVPSRSRLARIAAAGSFSVKELRRLNNELLKNQVPPTTGGYSIKIPTGSRNRIAADLLRTHTGDNEGMVKHTLRKGETLSRVSKRYDVPVAMIMRWNDITNVRRVQAGRQLTIYSDKDRQAARIASSSASVDARSEKKTPGIITLAGSKKRRPNSRSDRLANTLAVSYYKVRNGDSLWSIARKLQVSTQEIKRWNSLNNSLLHPGKKLVIKKS